MLVQAQRRRVARENYNRNVRRARIADLWGYLTGSETNLVRFEDVAQRLGTRQRMPRGIRLVKLQQIVGSVGRAQDFTRHFLPRPNVNSERWAGIDVALNAMAVLPPVELYQIGEAYFVKDGHHRISVAQANQLTEIEADIIELESPMPLKMADFQGNRWMQVLEKANKENKMYHVIDADLAKHGYAERLQKAEHERFLQEVQANQPTLLTRLRQRLGEFLITFGTRLKTQYQTEFA